MTVSEAARSLLPLAEQAACCEEPSPEPDAAALAAAAGTVAEAAQSLLPLAEQAACCEEPDVQHGLYCGVQLDEPTCFACGTVAPTSAAPLLPEPAATAMAEIIATLRVCVGVGGAPAGQGDDVDLDDEAQSEVTGSDASGFTKMDGTNTYLCDGFLYNQRDQDTLEEGGRLRCCYCPDCGALYPTGTERCLRRRGSSAATDADGADLECGGKVEPRRWVTNSLPLDQGMRVFTGLLPAAGVSSSDLRGKTVVDVGSRLGNNLLATALLTDASHAVGIEINETIAALSIEHIAESASLANAQSLLFTPEARTAMSVLCIDVREPTALKTLERADVLMFSNPFELHMTREEQ